MLAEDPLSSGGDAAGVLKIPIAIGIRDILGVMVTLGAAVIAELCLMSLFAGVVDVVRHLLGTLPLFEWALVYLLFAGSSFFAILAGIAVSPRLHRLRNSWIFTGIGLIVYSVVFCKIIFAGYRGPKHAAVYVLLTTPDLYCYAFGGFLASVVVMFWTTGLKIPRETK